MARSDRKPVLAVDLGGTKIVAAVITADNEVLSRYYCLTLAEKGRNSVIDRLLFALNEAMLKAKLTKSELAGLSIAAAGIIDTRRGIVTTAPNLPGWRDVPLRDIIAERLGLATCLINDASAAALGSSAVEPGWDWKTLYI